MIQLRVSLVFVCLALIAGCAKNTAPTCTITTPGNGAEIEQGTLINIKVVANDEDDNLSGVRIDLDGNMLTESNSQNLTYNWNTENVALGSHTLKAIAKDDEGEESQDIISVSIIQTDTTTAVPPVADFAADQIVVFEGDTVHFTDLSTNSPISWYWTLNGIPNVSNEQNPSVVYNTAGTYTISLDVANNFGNNYISKTNYIEVHIRTYPAEANFSASHRYGIVGDTVYFTDLSTNEPNQWLWTFEGATPGSSTEQNPYAVYSTTGTFSVTLTSTNATGPGTKTETGYISILEMNTPCPGTPNVWDLDSNEYSTVQIGAQCWMASNLSVGKRIGTTIASTDNGIIEKYCYDNDSMNCVIYGALYEWNELMNYAPSDNGSTGTTTGICPSGWHIPTDMEWKTLEQYLGVSAESLDSADFRGAPAGSMLAGYGAFWQQDYPILVGNPDFGRTGFNALPGGWRAGSYGWSSRKGTTAYFLTATENGTGAITRVIDYFSSGIKRESLSKTDGFSVRCIRN